MASPAPNTTVVQGAPSIAATAKYKVLFEGRPTACGSCADWCSRTKWLITDQFIQRETGLCCVQIDNLQIIRIKDITFTTECCSCCCAWRNCINIISADPTDPSIKIRGIPEGQTVFQNIRNAMDALHGMMMNLIVMKFEISYFFLFVFVLGGAKIQMQV